MNLASRRPGLTLIGIAALALAGACGQSPPPPNADAPADTTTTTVAPVETTTPTTVPATSSTTTIPDRTGVLFRRFTVVTASENGAAYSFRAGTMIVQFRQEATRQVASVSGGCNGVGGAMRATNERIELIDGYDSTAMLCEAQLMAQDQWMSELLIANPYWRWAEGRLTLEGAGRRIEAVPAD